MTEHDRLVAGFISHGFREVELEPELIPRRKFIRLGREPRWVEPDGTILVGETVRGSLRIPVGSDYHTLLLKCGDIWLRTRERSSAPRQGNLALDADAILDRI